MATSWEQPEDMRADYYDEEHDAAAHEAWIDRRIDMARGTY